MQKGIRDSLPTSSPETPYCPPLQGLCGARDLGDCLCHVPSGTTVVLDGDKSRSPPSLLLLLLSPGNCLSNTFLAYLPTPRECGTRAEVLPHPMQGKGLPGTALPGAQTLPSANTFP